TRQTIVPTGSFTTLSAPARPAIFFPIPCPPFFALMIGSYKRLARLSTCRSARRITSPPRPPSPPSGPPFGTNFSRRKLTLPRPPFPACAKTLTRSTNILGFSVKQLQRSTVEVVMLLQRVSLIGVL